MKTAGVKEARDRFSAYLDEVRRGKEVVITEHGRPVAMLIPIGGASKETLAYWRAVADGTIEQQTSPGSKPGPPTQARERTDYGGSGSSRDRRGSGVPGAV